MSRKYKSDNQIADKSTYGSNSRPDNVHERKKYNKDEDNYFEGTVASKNKKIRKPRTTSENTLPLEAPSSFTVRAGPSGPPPVNAWSQKKGSALFNKASDEIDEEDEMLKLALKESLKTAEEDKRRQLERLRQINLEGLPSMNTTLTEEKDWESKINEDEQTPHGDSSWECSSTEELSQVKPEPVAGIPKPKLHFTKTNSVDHTPAHNQKRVTGPQRANTSSSLSEKSTDTRSVSKKGSVDTVRSQDKSSSPATNDSSDDGYEPSRPCNATPSSGVNDNNDSQRTSKTHKQKIKNNAEPPAATLSQERPLPKSQLKRPIVIIDRENNSPAVNEITSSFNSTLTFGDTQDLFEKIENDYDYIPPKHNQSESDNPVEIAETNSSPSIDDSVYSSSTETDIMIHNFIRHEPPPLISTSTQNEESTDVFHVSSSPHGLSSDTTYDQQHSTQNGLILGNVQSASTTNDEPDSRSSVSNSPLHNVNSYNCYDSQIPVNLPGPEQTPPQNAPIPYTYPAGVQNNEEAVQLNNHNLASHMPYPNIPPGYIAASHPLRAMVPLNPQLNQIPGIPQYCLPSSNVMMPQLPVPSHYHSLMAINAYHQFQQPHIVAMNASENLESLQKEQINDVNSQVIQTQNQSEMIQTHNRPQVIPTQNQPQYSQAQSMPQMVPIQNQPQMIPLQSPTQITPVPNQIQTGPTANHSKLSQTEEALSKHNVILNEYQQQMYSQNHVNQSASQNGKTKEELVAQYQQTLQMLSQLRQQLAESNLQSGSSHIPQHPAYIYPTPTLPVGMNSFYPGIPVLSQVPPQHLMQQVPPASQLSPNTHQGYLNSGGPQNTGPEQTVAHPTIGRGRGRLS